MDHGDINGLDDVDDLDRPPALAAAAPAPTLDDWVRRVPYAVMLSVGCFFVFPVAFGGGLGYGLALLAVAVANALLLGRRMPRAAEAYAASALAPVLLLVLFLS